MDEKKIRDAEVREDMMGLKNWAVVGASENEERVSNKIVKKLVEHGYRVFPINPKSKEIEGLKVYKSIKDVPEKIDVVNMVVNPKLTAKVLEEASEIGVENIWFQDGSFNDELVEKARELGLRELTGSCIYFALIMKEMED